MEIKLSEMAGAGRRHLLKAQAQKARAWYRIENKTQEDEVAIYIYDEIGFFGTTANQFVKDLQGVTASRINLHLNTPGGDMWDGVAIYTALRSHPSSVTIYVDSLAASSGSLIAMAGERIVMAPHSMLMIHDPYAISLGNAAAMRQIADVLDKAGDSIAGIYADRAGGSVREWRDRMLAETWYSDREAVDAGLADEVDGDEPKEVVKNAFDLSIFKHPPEGLAVAAKASASEPTKRDIERILRDAGLSRAAAKTMAASYSGVDPDEARDAAELERLLEAMKVLA